MKLRSVSIVALAAIGVTGNTLRWRAHVGLRWESLGREVDGGRFGTFEVRAALAGSTFEPATVDGGAVGMTFVQTLLFRSL